MVSDRYRYVDCLVQGCSKSECGTTFDELEVGALVLVLSMGSVGNQKWLYHGTRCQACLFDGKIKTKPYAQIFKRPLEEYSDKINFDGPAYKLTVNKDPIDHIFDPYRGDYQKPHSSGRYDADIENLYQKVSR